MSQLNIGPLRPLALSSARTHSEMKVKVARQLLYRKFIININICYQEDIENQSEDIVHSLQFISLDTSVVNRVSFVPSAPTQKHLLRICNENETMLMFYQ